MGLVLASALLGACGGTQMQEQGTGGAGSAATLGSAAASGSDHAGSSGAEAVTNGGDSANGATGGDTNPGEGGAAAVGGATSVPPEAGACSVLTNKEGSDLARLERTLLSPVANVRAIATEGQTLWLSYGRSDDSVGRFVRYELASGKIIAQLTTPGLPIEPGSSTGGIEISGDELLVTISGVTNQIVRVSRESGAIVGVSGSPTFLGPSELAWLNGELLVSTGTGRMFAVSFEPPASVRSFTSAHPDGDRDSGVATCNGVVVWGGLFAGMTVLSPSGAKLGVITREGQDFGQLDLGPLTFFGNELVVASSVGLDFYSIEPTP